MAKYSKPETNLFFNYIYVFIGNQGKLPGGVFSTRPLAEEWIQINKLSGRLTEYPIDLGVYDWAVGTGRVRKLQASYCTPDIVGGFSSHLDHWHFEDGLAVA